MEENLESLFEANKLHSPEENNAAREKAREVKERLLKGWDMVQSAKTKKEDILYRDLYQKLEEEYLRVKKLYAQTEADLHRCPDCPYLGQNYLYFIGNSGVACDTKCPAPNNKNSSDKKTE